MFVDRRHLLQSAGLLGLAAAMPAGAADPAMPGDAAARALLDRTAEALLADYPENAAYLGIDAGARAALKGRVNDRSTAAEHRRAGDCTARLAALKAIDRARLSPAVALDVEVTQAAHQLAADGWRRMPVGDVAVLNNTVSYRSTPYAVSAGTGAFVEVPDLLETKHGVANTADAEAYLARIEGYAAALDAETARVLADGARGVILPGFLLDIAASQLAAGAAQPAAEWSLVRSLADKCAKAGLTGDWPARATRLATDRVAPALNRQVAALKTLRPRAPIDAGVWAQPGGADWYPWLVEAGTTTRSTPDQIHASGLEQCRALSAEIDALLRKQGLTQGSVGERLTALGKRPDLLFAGTDAGRAELLAYLNRVVADIRPRMARAFGRLVPGNLLIQRVPPAIQDGAPNGYAGPGSLDGTTPGIFYINLKDPGIWPRFALPTLVYHEGIPGHVWQGEYVFKLPLIRTLLAFNAYSEGWALYAEQTADEVGAYDADPVGRIGYLQSMLFRAARLVCDTGLHHKRWSFDQAMQWLMATTGYGASQAGSELRRYCIWPGQALGYKTGHNEINRLRAAAKTRLGGRYDVRRFNDLVVSTGGVPLSVLGGIVGRWEGA